MKLMHACKSLFLIKPRHKRPLNTLHICPKHPFLVYIYMKMLSAEVVCCKYLHNIIDLLKV